MHAVINTHGRQVLVRPGDKIQLEGTDKQVGDEISFDRVLAVGGNVGTPEVSGASVRGKVISVGRGKKIIIQKFKRRKKYRRRNGFRASLYQVEITDVAEG